MTRDQPAPGDRDKERRAKPPHTHTRIKIILGGATVVAGGIGTWAGLRLASVNLPFLPVRLAGGSVAGAGLVLVLLGVAACRITPRFGLLAATLAWLTIFLGWAGYHPPRSGERWLAKPGTPVVWTSETDWFEGYIEFDERYGHRGIPNIRARQHTREFDVHYTHDPEGFRVMPEPTEPSPHPEILFLGCSFTYGIGVEDDQTYPAILAAEAWPGFKVRNLACSAYGTTHCLLVLRAALEGSTPPAAVFYGFIGEHLKRNSLRRSWQNRMGSGRVPHFSEEGDYLGMVDSEQATLPESPATDEIERRTTRAVVRALRDLCAERGVPFFLLVLQERNHGFMAELRQDLGDRMIELAAECADLYSHDGHPTPYAQREIARAIAANRQFAEATGLVALYQPSAIAAAPDADALRLKLNPEGPGTWGARRELGSGKGPVRLESIAQEGQNPYEVGLTRRCLPIERNGRYVLELRARADRARRVTVNVASVLPPYEDCGFSREILLTPLWRDFSIAWTGARDEGHAMAAVFAGGSVVPIEIGRLEVRQLDEDQWIGYWVETDDGDPRNHARLAPGDEDRTAGFRLEQITSPDAVDWHIRVARRGLALEAGKTYRLSGWARADSRRPVGVAVMRDEAPYPVVGLTRRIELTRAWQPFAYEFIASETGPAVLAIQAGESEVPLEMEDVRLEEVEGGAMNQSKPGIDT